MILFSAGLLLFASLPVERAIEREVPHSDVSYLLVDARTRETVASRWPNAARPISLGSLVKPFVALAALEAGVVPAKLTCGGDAERCWLPKGHGTLTLDRAIAHSCNAAFLKLAARVPAADLERVCSRFALVFPGDNSADTRIGLGGNWKIAPTALAAAYLELLARKLDPGVPLLLEGLRGAAREGTARALNSSALAKTGTAPCASVDHRHAGDGFTVALFPPESPRYLLLVRVHGVPGAQSAKAAGRIAKLVLNESK